MIYPNVVKSNKYEQMYQMQIVTDILPGDTKIEIGLPRKLKIVLTWPGDIWRKGLPVLGFNVNAVLAVDPSPAGVLWFPVKFAIWFCMYCICFSNCTNIGSTFCWITHIWLGASCSYCCNWYANCGYGDGWYISKYEDEIFGYISSFPMLKTYSDSIRFAFKSLWNGIYSHML